MNGGMQYSIHFTVSFAHKKSKRITFWRIMFCASFFCWYAFIRTCYFQANSCLFPGIPNESSFSRVVWRCFYGVLLTSLLAINSSVLRENVRGGAERCRSYIFVLAKSLLKYDMSWAGRDLEKQAGIASIAAAAQTLHRIRRLIAPKRYISSPTYSLLVSTTVHQWQKFKCQCLVQSWNSDDDNLCISEKASKYVECCCFLRTKSIKWDELTFMPS